LCILLHKFYLNNNDSTIIMKLREKIQLTLQEELEPLGFRYYKSLKTFKRSVDKNIIVGMYYDADCFHHGFTDITLYLFGEYRDLENVLNKLQDRTFAQYGRVVCRLQWLLPEGEMANLDLSFQDSDSEETYNRKLRKLICQMKTYALPYLERLSHKDSAIEEAIALDRRDLFFIEGVVPVMYCVWKHDKKAALDYLEEKRQRFLGRVEPWEWERLERFKNGERFGGMEQIKNGVQYGVNNPLNAYAYDEFMGFVSRFNEWLETQNL